MILTSPPNLKLGLFDGSTGHGGTGSMFDKGGHWVTIDGAHVHINGAGKIDKGPAHLVGKTHTEAEKTPHPSPAAKAGADAANKAAGVTAPSAMTKGVFGQSVVDAGTGKQNEMFDTRKAAPASEPIKGSKSALDPKNTAEMFPKTPAEAGKAAANEAAHKPLDHGELNIPGRTKNINRDLDRYKAEQASKAKIEQKANAVERRDAKAKAKELAAQHMESIIARYGDKFDKKELRATLDSMVKWQPKKFIQMVYRHVAETAAA